MKSFVLARRAAFIAGLGVLSATAIAEPANYIDSGHSGPNATTYSFIATSEGDVTAYFAGQTAGYSSVIGMSVNGGPVGPTGLLNHTSNYGDSLLLGHVLAGQVITFVLQVNQLPVQPTPVTYTWYSNPALNYDGLNHIYSSPYVGDVDIPAGTYVGFEDLPAGGDSLWPNDYDYDDHQFVFIGPFEAHATPDGGSTLALLGLASLGMIAVHSRRK
jgi:MYXO-CTERM domain-containing protein